MSDCHLGAVKAEASGEGVGDCLIVGSSSSLQGPRYQGGGLPVSMVSIKLAGVVNDAIVFVRLSVRSTKQGHDW